MNAPSDEHGVVGHKHEAACDTGDTDSTKPAIESSKDSHIATLEELTEANLKDGERDTDEEEGKKVWDEESSSAVLKRERWEAPHVTETIEVKVQKRKKT
jgi:hypothetical protein